MMSEDLEQLVRKMIASHVKDDHYPISHEEISRLIREGERHNQIVEKVVEMIEGKPIIGPSGHVIGREDGLMHTVQKSNAMLVEIDRRTNGGVTVTQKIKPELTNKQKGYVWGFAGTVVASLVTSTTAIIVLLVGG